MTTTATSDLDARLAQTQAHVRTLTGTRDAVKADLESADRAHRDALTAADTSSTVKINADRRRLREALADAEADLATATGWLAQVQAEVDQRAQDAAAADSAQAASAALEEFKTALAAISRSAEERVALIAAAAEEQASEMNQLRAAREMALTELTRARTVARARDPFVDPTLEALETALRASDALTRAWRPNRALGATMLDALVGALRASRPEFHAS